MKETRSNHPFGFLLDFDPVIHLSNNLRRIQDSKLILKKGHKRCIQSLSRLDIQSIPGCNKIIGGSEREKKERKREK